VVCTRAPTTLVRSRQTPRPGGAGTKIPAVIPYRSSRTDDAQALTSYRLSGAARAPSRASGVTLMHFRPKESHHMTTIALEQRTAVGPHRRELHKSSWPARLLAPPSLSPAPSPRPPPGRRCTPTPRPMRPSSSCPGCYSWTMTGPGGRDRRRRPRARQPRHAAHIRDNTRHSGMLPHAAHQIRPGRMIAASVGWHRDGGARSR